jgi:mono/diheme cytochrome c family protein
MKRFLSFTVFSLNRPSAVLAVIAALAWAGTASAQDLPDGPGKAVVAKVCGACHGVDYVTNLKHTKAEWKSVVDTMIGYGATATDQEIDTIVDYLAKNFGRSEGQIERAAAKSARAVPGSRVR